MRRYLNYEHKARGAYILTALETLIQALCLEYFVDGKLVLAAPTDKAARNLTERTGLPARTVHSALGKIPNEDFLDPVK